MELPPAIAPWGPELAMFHDELALALGGLVARVAHAIGPLPSATRDARDEPDGFGGLARRGPYERLLLTEWLLANELPDEFVRRAVSAEHAFLELEHLSPAIARRTIAVFDAGPSQLGAPRLAIEILAAQDGAGGTDEGDEQVELPHGEREDPPGGEGHSRCDADFEAPGHEHFGVRRGGGRFHARHAHRARRLNRDRTVNVV